jgi:hypothetical protein
MYIADDYGGSGSVRDDEEQNSYQHGSGAVSHPQPWGSSANRTANSATTHPTNIATIPTPVYKGPTLTPQVPVLHGRGTCWSCPFKAIHRGLTISVGECRIFCWQVTYNHGHFYLTGGGVGALERGPGIGWVTAPYDQQERLSAQVCGAYILGVCGTAGGRPAGDGLWYGVTIISGGGFQVGGGYTRRIL